MSESNTEAADCNVSMELIVGMGRLEKDLIQESRKVSSKIKPGRMERSYGQGGRGGNQEMNRAAWSEPMESWKDIETDEKHPVHKAALLSSIRSKTESHWKVL